MLNILLNAGLWQCVNTPTIS